MFGVHASFQFTAALTEQEIERIRREAIEPLTREPGFRHYYAVQSETGQVGAFHVWDSREQAEAAQERLAPRLAPLLEGKLVGPPQRVMSELVAEWSAAAEP